jgi:hypothetical protein
LKLQNDVDEAIIHTLYPQINVQQPLQPTFAPSHRQPVVYPHHATPIYQQQQLHAHPQVSPSSVPHLRLTHAAPSAADLAWASLSPAKQHEAWMDYYKSTGYS